MSRAQEQRELAAQSDAQLVKAYWAWHDATVESRIRRWIDFADDKRNVITAELRRRGVKLAPRA